MSIGDPYETMEFLEKQKVSLRSLYEKLEKLEESRDELLSALKVAAQEEDGYVFKDTIQRAEALKEKEA